ncbi:MAG: UDP-N-acetylglucosamine 2-epimerase (non-hydrolyzing), partial [Anaerolineae bacterium]|nr:UDP-N-acetylglucosamine 2-epimerase (non-hydrolyzing) [Anaerolineae bacterium]
MQPNQTLAGLTARALTGISDVIEHTRPDVVLSQGDTTTAMVAAMAAFYQRIPAGHVEAGLRTNDIYNPFPEEVNRRLISVMARYHFAPTTTAEKALLAEGVAPETISITGNTVIDALQWTVAKKHPLTLNIPLDRRGERLILVTAHRRESFGTAFESMCRALRQIAEENPDVRLVYPVHLNPNVQEPVRRILGGLDRVHLIEPLAYPDFAHLMNRSTFLITDSGGLQEEAPALGKPVLVMRRTTERPEAVEAGTARLVGTEQEAIVSAANELLHNPEAYRAMATAISPFGDGHASDRIATILLNSL